MSVNLGTKNPQCFEILVRKPLNDGVNIGTKTLKCFFTWRKTTSKCFFCKFGVETFNYSIYVPSTFMFLRLDSKKTSMFFVNVGTKPVNDLILARKPLSTF